MSIKRIDHIAIVVPDAEEAATFYQGALGLKLTHVEQVDDQEVIVAFLPTGESEIELVEPISETSSVARYLNKHGSGIHHICLEVDSITETLARLKAAGVQLINEEPTTGSGGKRSAFVHPKSTYGVLIEFYESTPEEPERRADIMNDLRVRLNVERQAVAAGVSTFLHALRAAVRAPASQNQLMGNPKGITLKAAEEPANEDHPSG